MDVKVADVLSDRSKQQPNPKLCIHNNGLPLYTFAQHAPAVQIVRDVQQTRIKISSTLLFCSLDDVGLERAERVTRMPLPMVVSMVFQDCQGHDNTMKLAIVLCQ